MRAQVIIPVIVSILILTVISLIPSSYAQVLFSDNFDDGDISEYQQFGGTWTTVSELGRGDVLRHTSNSNTVIFPQSESFSNSYQVIAEIWNEDNDAVGVAFGINPVDPDNLYSCSASADSAFNSGIWEHVNDVNGPPTNQLATQSWNYKRSTWYTVTITVDQNTNTINCTWESQAGVELDVTATIPNPTPSGSVGIWLSHQDNFKGDLLEVRTLGPPDTEFPQLSIQDPQNITYNISEVPLNYMVSDNVGLSGCSYNLDGNITPLPNCQNTILSSLTLSPPSHSITVSATDTSGNTSTSPVITFFVNKDTSPPQWNPVPENIVLLEGQPLFYDADATDNNSAVSFSISDEIKFKIGLSTGILENNINPLLVGTYPLTLSATDGYANVNSVSISIIVQAVGVTPPGYKVAFIADQGSGSTATAVLNVILNEGADMVMHQGDFDYGDDPDAWDAKITSVLGPDFPYFASVGNHDDGSAVWPAYQQKLTDRLALIDGAVCTFGSGGIGVKQSCTYNGLFFVLSGVGTLESNHATYIQNEMANDNSIWRICSWHKNMNAMQLGTKGDSTGWEVYEECRMAGAIVATGHEHTYSRTRTLSSVQNQIVDPAWPDTNNVRVGEGSTFVFVAGLGGAGMRDQNRCLPFAFPYGCNGEWASIYTTDQNSKHGALFCSFNVGGQANKAHCYFKDIDGNIPDQFDVTSFNSVPAGSPPTAQPDTATTAEDSPVNVDVLANDSDPDGNTLLLASFDSTSSNGGTIARDDNGTPGDTSDDILVYTPSLNFNGVDTFNYTVSDGTQSDTGSVTVTVTATNDAPTADDQSVTTQEDTSVSITLTASDVDGDPLTYNVVSFPLNGQLTGTAPNLTYTPDPDYNGADSFTFVANDGSLVSNTATVSITVNPVNDTPTADDQSVTTQEDTAVSITLTASDIDGDPLTYSVQTGPSNGLLSGTAPNLTYTPDPDYNGADSFTFVANDGTVDSNLATVSITVNPVNDAPTADDQSVTTSQDTPVNITLTGSDVDGDSITFAIVGVPGSGTLSNFDSVTGAVTYTPNGGFFGSDSFTFNTNVGLMDSSTATVSITVEETNVAPVLDPVGDKTSDELTELTFTATANDSNIGQILSFSLDGGSDGSVPAGASISPTTGIFTWTPTESQGPDSYTFDVVVSDNGLPPLSDSETITVTINEVNVAPTADDQSVTTQEDTSVSITLTASDVDGNPLTYSVVSGPSNGVLSGTAPNLTYTPDPNFNGNDSFDFVANDGTVDSTPATVSITVTQTNKMHVESIDMSAKVKGKSTKSQIFTSVTIFDTNGNPVSGAQVTIELTGFNAGVTDTATTDSNGIAAFTFSSAKAGNIYTSEVTNVSNGLTYDSLSNVKTSDSITI